MSPVMHLPRGPRTTSKTLYVVGAPASGKSTAVLLLLDLLGVELVGEETLWPGQRGVFKGMRMESVIDGSERGVYLGNLGTAKRQGFPGTDGLSMAAPPVAIEWYTESPSLPALIVGEGARLSGDKVITAMAENTRLTVGYLFADSDTLDQRCEQRGSDQAATFRKAAATRAESAVRTAYRAGAHIMPFETSRLSPEYVARKLHQAISR